MDQPEALVEVAFMRECALEVVEHRHELLDQPLVGARGQLLLVARHPLAVVVELGLQPLERVEVLVALRQRGRELVDGLFLLTASSSTLVFGHSSTTSYSASSTTSSSEGAALPSAPVPPGCDDEACA